jgi:hypothetical protein
MTSKPTSACGDIAVEKGVPHRERYTARDSKIGSACVSGPLPLNGQLDAGSALRAGSLAHHYEGPQDLLV